MKKPSNKIPENAQRLGRVDAAAYVTATFGIPCSPLTLAKLASTGGGPAFRKAGQTTLYETPDLDVWASTKLGPRVYSTSEARKAA